MTEPRLVIHAGYPKAASTTLQNGLFFKLHRAGAINFVGRAWESGQFGGLASKPAYKQWLRAVMTGADAPSLLADRPLADDRTNLFSEGLFITNEKEAQGFVMPARIRRAFAASCSSPEVFLIVRNQADLIMSYYVQQYKKMEQKDFEAYLQHQIGGGWSGPGKIFDYCALAEAYGEAFGRERVHLLLFEDLVADLETFSANLGRVLEVEPGTIRGFLEGSHLNKTPKTEEYRVVRKLPKQRRKGWRKALGRLAERFGAAPPAAEPIRIAPMTAEERRAIFDSFAESNEELARRFRLDSDRMRAYGYF